MIILFKILSKAFMAILDFLLLDFFLRSSYTIIYKKMPFFLKTITYISFFISIVFINNFIMYTFIHLVIIIWLLIIYSYYHISKMKFLKEILLFYLLSTIVQFISIIIFIWLLNTNIYTFYFNAPLAYTTLCHIVSNYIVYAILIIYFKKNIKFYFKFYIYF